MRISGWLPVSYSVYMAFESRIGKECYDIAKYVADALNDNSKITNARFFKSFAKHLMLDDSKLARVDGEDYILDINLLINFIRDSFIIYNDTIETER
jgi:hypothetical protein